MKIKFVLIFLLFILASSSCKSNNKKEIRDYKNQKIDTENVICKDLQDASYNKIKKYLISNNNFYLNAKLKIDCYRLSVTDKEYFILIGFEKNNINKQRKILILDSINFNVVFNSKGYGDIISITPKFVDLNGDKKMI